MAELGEVRKSIFVLTGPREGYSGVLGGRYWFRDGELAVLDQFKDKVKLVLCNNYACNIKDEKPIWKTTEVDGKKASIKIGEMSKPTPAVTTVMGDPVASVVIPPSTPKVEVKVDPLPVDPNPVDTSKVAEVKPGGDGTSVGTSTSAGAGAGKGS